MRILLATVLMAVAVSPSYGQCTKNGSCTKTQQVAVQTDGPSCCDTAKQAGYSVCPDCLKSSFQKAAAKLATMPQQQKVALASATTCTGSQCPVGKRMEPTMAFLTDAVDLVYAFDNAFEQMASQKESPLAGTSDETRALFEQRRQTIATVHEVMVAQNAAFAHCRSGCDKVSLTSSDTSSSCSGSCSATKTAVATVATGDSKSCSGSCSATKTANVATAGSPANRMNALFARAQVLDKKADKLLACWKMCPDELAKLGSQDKVKIEQATATMNRLNPAMKPMVKAVALYSEALQRAASVNTEMMAAWAGNAGGSKEAGTTAVAAAVSTDATATSCAAGGECPINRLLQKTARIAANVQGILGSMAAHDQVSSTK